MTSKTLTSGKPQNSSIAYSLKGVLKGGSWLAITRLLSLIGNFILVAFIPRLLSIEEFGVWTVVTSVTGLLATFTLGLGPAVRNDLAVLKHELNHNQENVVFFSVLWFLLIFLVVLSILGGLSQIVIDYNQIFTINNRSLAQVAGTYLVLASVLQFLSLPFSLIGHTIYAYHYFKLAAIYQFATTIVPQLIGLVAAVYFPNTLLALISVTFFMRIVVSLAFTAAFMYIQDWNLVLPPSKTIWRNVNRLRGASFQFWLFNLAWLVLFTTDTIIINKIIDVTNAGHYNLLLKIYFTLVTLYTVVVAPLWSFYTDAARIGDWTWIHHALKKAWAISVLGIAIISLLIVPISNPLIEYWTGVQLDLGFGVVLACASWAIVYVWVHCFAVFLSGINQMRYQVLTLVLGAIVNIPLTIYMLSTWGIIGAPIATIISLLPTMIVGPLQSYRLVHLGIKDG